MPSSAEHTQQIDAQPYSETGRKLRYRYRFGIDLNRSRYPRDWMIGVRVSLTGIMGTRRPDLLVSFGRYDLYVGWDWR